MKQLLKLAILFIFFNHLPGQAQEITINLLDSINRQEAYLKQIENTLLLKREAITVSDEMVRQVLDKQPAFGVNKDNYFLIGIPFDKAPDKSNSDIHFQLSIRHRLTKSTLPFNSFLFVTYTQRSFWNIFEHSSPFKDNNYNPGIGIGRYYIRNNKLKGAFALQIEHESNGKDGEKSRSWNYLNLSSKFFYNMRTAIKLEAYIPYIDGQYNKDLLKYKGYGTIVIDHISKNQLWWYSVKLNPRDKFINMNTEASVAYRVNKKWNQYLMLTASSGYGESLLEYKEYRNMIRVGFVIKPDFYNIN